MSDFGVSITIKKNSGVLFSNGEINTISALVNELKGLDICEDSLGEPFQFTLSSSEKEVVIVLSEYWFGEETEESLLDFTISDKDETEKIVNLLKLKLGKDYSFEIYHGGW